jgi:hypothetical protein
MDEEIERLVIAVRADTSGFARDVAAMRDGLEGPLASGAARAGRSIETALARALVTGKFGFEELRSVALKVLADIAGAAVRSGLRELLGGIGQGGGERGGPAPGGLLTGLIGALSGLPGRATGGPVAPGSAYWVGERGPELFVPTASGRVETLRERVVERVMQAPAPRERPVERTTQAGVIPAPLVPAGQASPPPERVIEREVRPMWLAPPAPPAPPPPRDVRVAITVHAPRGEAPAALAQSSRQVAHAVRRALAEG